MMIIYSLLLASSAPVLPHIDRAALELQAQAEALQAPVRSGGVGLAALGTICGAAANQTDPAEFIATLSRAYRLSPAQGAALRASCAGYLAGRADAGRRITAATW
jgi:hypothetical protein